jgi:phosphoribosylamine---glycine ligase
MKILVIGSGGREHALCWRIARSPLVTGLFCAPGNLGTATCATNVAIAATDLERLTAFARQEEIGLTVVGPEAPLCAGIADRFAAEKLRLAGPSAAAARLEGSKAFAKEFLERHGIPTAASSVFEDADAAMAYIDGHPEALVVKADGLAAGKGVVVASSPDEAKAAARRILEGSVGDAGRRVVIEERLRGEEVSFIAVTDGERVWPLASSQDHKAVGDGDRGPNTGGMGAYSPAPVLDERLAERALHDVIEPAVGGMAEEGTPYRGFLYAGLMVSAEGSLSVLEFNCRLGDPETQPLMVRLRSDLVPYLVGIADGQLPTDPPIWEERSGLCVVMAAAGYPESHQAGDVIEGVADAEALDGIKVFHAGTARREGQLITAGGRVLGVTALGRGVVGARARAYEAVRRIRWAGAHYRSDIGHRALGRG